MDTNNTDIPPESKLYLDVKGRGAGSISIVERPDSIEGGSVHNSEGNSQEKGDVNLEWEKLLFLMKMK